jgi:hypothetical protein
MAEWFSGWNLSDLSSPAKHGSNGDQSEMGKVKQFLILKQKNASSCLSRRIRQLPE